MANTNDLLRCLRIIRNAAPEEYANLLVAFNKYKDDQVLAAVVADHATVLAVQGQARQCLALSDLLHEATTEPGPR